MSQIRLPVARSLGPADDSPLGRGPASRRRAGPRELALLSASEIPGDRFLFGQLAERREKKKREKEKENNKEAWASVAAHPLLLHTPRF